MEVARVGDSYHGQHVADIHDGRFVTGSYVIDWVQPLRIPEIFGARNLGLDPNNIEYYLISEEERQRRLKRERNPFSLTAYFEPPPSYTWISDRDREREYEFIIGSPDEQEGLWAHDWGGPEEEDEET